MLRPVCEHPDCLHVVDVVSRTDVLAARGSDYFSRVARVLEACGNTTGSTRERGRPSKRRRDGATAVVDGGAAGTVSVPWEVDLVVLHERLGRPLVPVSVPDATANCGCVDATRRGTGCQRWFPTRHRPVLSHWQVRGAV